MGETGRALFYFVYNLCLLFCGVLPAICVFTHIVFGGGFQKAVWAGKKIVWGDKTFQKKL